MKSLSTPTTLILHTGDNPKRLVGALQDRYWNLKSTISSYNMLRHGRDVHPTWVKSSIGTLSNTRVWDSVVQGQSPKRTLTVTDDEWLTA